MIKQVFDIESYWEVVVYYSLDYNFFDDVALELRMTGFKEAAIEEVYKALKTNYAKAVTCSKVEGHRSVVIFNKHESKIDYISSIVHEAEHVKQAVLKAYHVDDTGEAAAYTIGFIVKKMYEICRELL